MKEKAKTAPSLPAERYVNLWLHSDGKLELGRGHESLDGAKKAQSGKTRVMILRVSTTVEVAA